MFEHFTTGARAAVTAYAPTEARLRGDRRLGTEHLLLGLLRDPATARAVGADLESARSAIAALDAAALLAIGIDASAVERPAVRGSSKGMPLTSGFKTAMARAMTEARRARQRRISPAHLMLALLGAGRTDPASDVLAHLGVDNTAARVRLMAVTEAS